jgi:two-component system LytT family response regulator
MPNSTDRVLRVLIVDDEPLSRDRLRAALAKIDGVDVMGECPDGGAAVAAIRRNPPDLVLLDVQMPGLDGFGVIEAVSAASMPPVIFVTAFDEFAVRAFEVHALDYLLKPFDDERLQSAIARATTGRDEVASLAARLRDLLAERAGRPDAASSGYARRLMVRRGETVHYVPLEEVDWIEAANNYVRLHGASGTHLVRLTLRELLTRLDPAVFVQIHRSTIVRFSAIKEIHPWAGGDYIARLHSGHELRISRTFREEVLRTVV